MCTCKGFSTFFAKCKVFITGYCRASSLHGFRNIATENVKWQESCFWLLICICSSVMTVIMFSMVWERFQRSPTMTTIETNNYPIKFVPFPAITICNSNKILKSSFDLMAKKFKDHGIEEWKLSKFLKDIPQIYSTRLTHFEYEEVIEDVMKKLNYNIENFMFELSQPCSQLLIRCLWLGKDYNCSSLFDEVKTSEGFCCSFNWQGPKITNFGRTNFIREKEIYVNDASTSLAGLTVVIDSDENNYFSAVDSFFGSVVILHSTYQYPDSSAPRAFIQPKSEAIIRLKATVVESSKDVRSLHIHQRQCYFEEEFPVGTERDYSYEACSLDCKLNTYHERCGCIPFYYPNVAKLRTCDFSDMKCIRKNRVASQALALATDDWGPKFSNGTCKCLPSCNDVTYGWIIQTNEIRSPNHASPIFEGTLGNRSAVSMFFEQNVCVKYRIESTVTWDSLIASFGGIFGLCLGGSIISLIELLYYLLYDHKKFFAKELKLRRIRRIFAKRQIKKPSNVIYTVFRGRPQREHHTKKRTFNFIY